MMVIIGMVVLTLAAKGIYYAAARLLNPDGEQRQVIKKSLVTALLSLIADAAGLVVFCLAAKSTVGVFFPHEKIIWLRAVIIMAMIHILAVYIGVFLIKRKRNADFPALNSLLCLFPISQLQINLYLSEEAHFSNLLFGEMSALSGIVSAILLMYILYSTQERKSLEESIKNHEIELEMLYRSKEQAALDETELKNLQEKYAKELDEIYDMIKNRSQKEEIQNMLDNLEREVSKTKGREYCENVVVNEIIREKEQQCINLGIAFTADIKLPKAAEVSRLHWCSIFNNLLSNAVNECSKLGADRKRYISISCGIKGDYLCIAAKNSANRPQRVFQRAKGLKEHGWGLKIMQDIASEYNGYFNTKYKNGEYQAVLMLSVQNHQEGRQNLEHDGILD